MKTEIYYESDANLALLDNRKIAIIGYGAQGAAHAKNVRDSGCQVVIGQRSGGPGYELARSDGFEPMSIAQAAAEADVINILLPDEVHAEVFERDIRPYLVPGNIVMTCHGFSFHYELVSPPAGIDRVLVAPKGQGHMVRGEFLRGGGVPCLIAVDQGTADETLQIGLAYAKALGGTKAGVIRTTIAAETETDLFGEQAVLCGGVTSLVQAGFDTLVDAGYQPELAYFECVHEMKIIVDLLYSRGMAAMRESISNTAEYGDYVSGPRVIDSQVRQNMKDVLADIQSGDFAKRFMDQHRDSGQELEALRQDQTDSDLCRVGQQLRSMMPWLEADGS